MTKTEKMELEALLYAQLEELPDELTDKTPVWIYGVAEVLTFTMGHSYAIVRNSYGETPNVVKSFGEGGIAEIVHIYPYKFLDKKYVPEFGSDSEAKSYLAKVYGIDKTELAKIKKETMLRLIYNYCIKRQLADEAEMRKIKADRAIAEAVREKHQEERENENNIANGE